VRSTGTGRATGRPSLVIVNPFPSRDPLEQSSQNASWPRRRQFLRAPKDADLCDAAEHLGVTVLRAA